MRTYELMLILLPTIEEKDSKKHDELIKKLTSGTSAQVKEITVLGKKTLQFSIAKQHEGLYLLIKLEATNLAAGSLTKQAKLIPEVIRLLLVGVG